MARQQVEWTPYVGAWSKGRITSPTGTYTGEQASRWAFLQDQAERRAKRKAEKNSGGRKKGRR